MQFFIHPFIEIVCRETQMNPETLFQKCKWERKAFDLEYKKLLREGHIKTLWENIRLRSINIIQRDKKSQRLIQVFHINYISRKELKDVIYYNEKIEKFFLYGALLGEEQREYLESHNDIKFDFERSDYRLLVEYNSLHPTQRWLLPEEKIPIVHVDRYTLFAGGLKSLLKDYFLQEFEWNYFDNPADALGFLVDQFSKNKYIHFIITDISLPLWDGCKFVKMIRRLEEKYNYRQTPIIALTMHDETSPVMVEAKKENLFTAHFTKDVDPDVFARYVNTILL
jgi:CheY-like chemotaxis protein